MTVEGGKSKEKRQWTARGPTNRNSSDGLQVTRNFSRQETTLECYLIIETEGQAPAVHRGTHGRLIVVDEGVALRPRGVPPGILCR